jgi:flagellar basal body-associated protein FliL
MRIRNRRNAGKLPKQLILMLACMGLGVGAKHMIDARAAKPAAAAAAAAVPGQQPAAAGAQPGAQPGAAADPAAAAAATAAAQPPTETVELGQFLVNVAATTTMHYLRADVALEIELPPDDGKKKKKGGEEGEGKKEKPKLPPEEELRAKDTIVQVMSDARFEALRGAEGRERLKAKLLQALQEKLPQEKLREVLLVSFVMQ